MVSRTFRLEESIVEQLEYIAKSPGVHEDRGNTICNTNGL